MYNEAMEDDGVGCRTLCATCERDTLPPLCHSAFNPPPAGTPLRTVLVPDTDCPYCQHQDDIIALLAWGEQQNHFMSPVATASHPSPLARAPSFFARLWQFLRSPLA